MKIRKYKTSDWQAISKIHDEARLDELSGTVDLNAFIPLEKAAFAEGLFGGEILVAEIEGEVAGFIGFNKKTIDWLYVSPAHYRKGIGRILIEYVLEKAEGDLRIAVLKNNIAALELYKKMGFKEERTFKGSMIDAEQYEAEGISLKWEKK
ncbi:MAG: GNAT family N-acetyltransferase [Bacteroidetes bacterium]|nr:GNAT family N-acetyltransferase [Bacteroidota bacterium]